MLRRWTTLSSPFQVPARAGRRLAGVSLRLWHRLPLTARFLVAFGLILSSVLSAVVWQLAAQYQRERYGHANTVCREETTEYFMAVEHRLGAQAITAFTAEYLRYRHLDAGEAVTISISAQGRFTVMSTGDTPSVREVQSEPGIARWLTRPPRLSRWASVTLASGHELRVLATPIKLHGAVVGTIVASVDLAEHSWVGHMVSVAAWEALAALAAAVGAAHFMLRRTLSAITRLRRAALTASPTGLSQRVSYDGPTDDAAGKLADAFNVMLERLDAAFTSQRQLLANVSHQLRTPLAVARGHLELAADVAEPAATAEVVAIAIDQIDHMRMLVDRLMMLGHALEPDFLERRPFPVKPLLCEVLDAARVLAPREWRLGPVADVMLDGDETKIRGALLNLVDNAVKASEEGSEIVLSARIDDGCVLEVADAGHGIAPADIGKVFDRFARPGARHAHGAGLGLAIVKAVAEAHGGQVSLRSRQEAGTSVMMRFPPGLVSGRAEPPGQSARMRGAGAVRASAVAAERMAEDARAPH